jgi:hypothetical protein
MNVPMNFFKTLCDVSEKYLTFTIKSILFFSKLHIQKSKKAVLLYALK